MSPGPSSTSPDYLASYYAPFDETTDHDWEHLELREPPTVMLAVQGKVAVRRVPVRGGFIILKSYTRSLWPLPILEPVDRSTEEHAWIMMMLSGDCCVRVSGRLFSLGKPAGFCMPVETPIPVRFRHPEVPMTRAEDIYALGLTIWELYTGRTPLLYGDETLEESLGWLERRTNVGMGPDMQAIDDPQIYALIETCLAAGPDCPDEYSPDVWYCVEAQVELGHCHAQPRHLYSRIVHAKFCPSQLNKEDGPCKFPYVCKKLISSPLACTKCNPHVQIKLNRLGVECCDVPSR
ncbi:hypothetical protein DFH06DRAFT_1295228 [Mycena polygramma]|nr:hypothetical protein DFH06DRAFT_1295228 [Mycena polygramma]